MMEDEQRLRVVDRSTEGRLRRLEGAGSVHSTPQRASPVGCGSGLARKSTSKLPRLTCVRGRQMSSH